MTERDWKALALALFAFCLAGLSVYCGFRSRAEASPRQVMVSEAIGDLPVCAPGRVCTSAFFRSSAGTVTKPGYTFSPDSTTGWYREDANNIGLAFGGVKYFGFDNNSTFKNSNGNSQVIFTATSAKMNEAGGGFVLVDTTPLAQLSGGAGNASLSCGSNNCAFTLVDRLYNTVNGSLPSCLSGIKGTEAWDTTNNCLATCDGSNWLCMPRVSGTVIRATLTGDVNTTAYPVNTDWVAFTGIVGTVKKMCWVPETVGTGAGNIVGTFYDRTGSANTSTLTIACASTQGTATCADATGSIAIGDTYGMRWTSDGCTLRPAGELTLTYEP